MRRGLKELDPPLDLAADVERTLVPDPPALVREGGFVRDGVDPELDELRHTSRGGRETIAAIEERERARTGIASLKVRFNRVFGYYIEVSRSNLALVPADYVRKQTIAGGERFITPELKQHEDRVLRADELIAAREQRLFEELRERLAAAARRIQQTSRAAAELDVLASLAEAATRFDYVKPRLSKGDELVYGEGRHPIMERVLREPFVANDLAMGDGAPRLFVLTGPNMGGKSTFLRQTALIALMAQMGSFVPAREAKLGLVDRIFTRVGASDQILRGQSTFMVEMQETAHILRHASERSLVLLDEIGRGTATFDGLSIAWAVAEHVAQSAASPKTIFATHYHELVDLAADIPSVGNIHVSAREWQDNVVFLRKIEPGGSDRSFGIQVARLAGLPSGVVVRAQEILRNLERTEFDREGRPRLAHSESAPPVPGRQLALFAGEDEAVLDDLRRADPDQLTPIQALALLAELKKTTVVVGAAIGGSSWGNGKRRNGGPRTGSIGPLDPHGIPVRPSRRPDGPPRTDDGSRQGSALDLAVMPLNHKDPLRELLDLQERMNRLFDQTLTRERLDEPAAAPGHLGPTRGRGRDRRGLPGRAGAAGTRPRRRPDPGPGRRARGARRAPAGRHGRARVPPPRAPLRPVRARLPLRRRGRPGPDQGRVQRRAAAARGPEGAGAQFHPDQGGAGGRSRRRARSPAVARARGLRPSPGPGAPGP